MATGGVVAAAPVPPPVITDEQVLRAMRGYGLVSAQIAPGLVRPTKNSEDYRQFVENEIDTIAAVATANGGAIPDGTPLSLPYPAAPQAYAKHMEVDYTSVLETLFRSSYNNITLILMSFLGIFDYHNFRREKLAISEGQLAQIQRAVPSANPKSLTWSHPDVNLPVQVGANCHLVAFKIQRYNTAVRIKKGYGGRSYYAVQGSSLLTRSQRGTTGKQMIQLLSLITPHRMMTKLLAFLVEGGHLVNADITPAQLLIKSVTGGVTGSENTQAQVYGWITPGFTWALQHFGAYLQEWWWNAAMAALARGDINSEQYSRYGFDLQIASNYNEYYEQVTATIMFAAMQSYLRDGYDSKGLQRSKNALARTKALTELAGTYAKYKSAGALPYGTNVPEFRARGPA